MKIRMGKDEKWGDISREKEIRKESKKKKERKKHRTGISLFLHTISVYFFLISIFVNDKKAKRIKGVAAELGVESKYYLVGLLSHGTRLYSHFLSENYIRPRQCAINLMFICFSLLQLLFVMHLVPIWSGFEEKGLASNPWDSEIHIQVHAK